MKELIRVRVQYASREQCCKTHKRPLPLPLQYTSLKPKQETCLTSLKTFYISVQTITNYLLKQHPSYRTHSATLPLSGPQPTSTSGHYTTCCKSQSYAPEDGQKSCPKHVELILEINKLLLLHLFGLSVLFTDKLRFEYHCRTEIRHGNIVRTRAHLQVTKLIEETDVSSD